MRGQRGSVGAVFLAGVILAALAVPSQALKLPESGDFRGSFDTTISYGVTVRAQDRDARIVAISNGGESSNINGDDGNLNYDKGDAVYNVIKVSHDLDLTYGRFGAFVRGSYYYDFANRTRESLGEAARNRTGKYAEFLDAYVRGSFPVFGNTLNLKVGQQAINWGESTFIGNGINVVNAVDLAKLRVPGSEIKEALLPTPAAWASQSLGRIFSLEGFVLADFDKVRTDPRGTYFSTDDVFSDDGNALYTGAGRRYDQHFPPTAVNLLSLATQTGQLYGVRSGDRTAEDSGQAGVALRILAPFLNNTEFGLYHMNYHSRIPYGSSTRGGVVIANPGSVGCGAATPYVNLPGLGNPLPDCTDVPASVYIEYPENIRLYGVSFNTSGPWGWAIQGEHSYRPNMPVQYTASEVAFAAGGLSTFLSGNNAIAAATLPFGTDIKGYERLEMHQSQVSLTKIYGPWNRMDVLTIIGEVGFTHMNLPEGKYFHGPAVTLAPGTNGGGGPNTNPIEGNATKDSWGYRLSTRLDFLNTFFQTNMSPRISFSHDVNGTGPTFVENVKALGYGLATTFKSSWVFDVSYTDFFGGREFVVDSVTVPPGQPLRSTSLSNSAVDRDFVSINLSYAF